MNNQIEEWTYTYDHDPRYQISNFGNVKGKSGKLFELKKDKDGYNRFAMYYDNNKIINQGVHRLVIYYFYPDQDEMADYFFDNNYVVDHIDGNPSNNHIANLRFATKKQNGHNQKRAKGYNFDKRSGKFRAQIRVNKKKIGLGYFDNENDARQAYIDASIKYYDTFSPH